MRDARQVKEMFSGISERYDLLNHLLSLNIDRTWRKRMIASLPPDSSIILDLGCGTADLGIAAAWAGKFVLGADFSHEMLLAGLKKIREEGKEQAVRLVEADALSLPVRTGSVDVVVTAFTIRNLADLKRGFSEMVRVLKPNGSALILEFSRPANPIMRIVYYPYLRFLVPLLGTLISRNRMAYRYLSSTIRSFPEREKIAAMMEEAGFAKASHRDLTGGIVTLYTGYKKDGTEKKTETKVPIW